MVEVPPELAEVPFADELDITAARPAVEADFLRRLRELVPAPAREYCTVATQIAEGRGAVMRGASCPVLTVPALAGA